MMKLKLCFKNIFVSFLKEQMGWSASASSSWCHLCPIPHCDRVCRGAAQGHQHCFH